MRRIIPDLLPGTNYAIQVRATTPGEVSEWSRRFLVLTNTNQNAPDSPTGLTWEPNGDAFHGEWNAVTTTVSGSFTKVVRYEVELTANSITRTESVLPHDVGKTVYDLGFETNRAFFLSPQPIVQLRVRAVDSAGLKGVWSNFITAQNPVPGAPSNVVVKESINTIDLSWSASTTKDVKGYAVYIGSTAGFVADASSRRAVGMTLGLTYVTTTYALTYFKIRAYDAFGQESSDLLAQGTPANPFGVDSTAPASPTGLTAAITIDSSLRSTAAVSWSQVIPVSNDLAGFQIRYRRVGDTSWMSVQAGPDDRAINVSLPIPYSNYEFQIRSYDFYANYSAWTGSTTATAPTNTAPSQPTAPSVASSTMQIQVTVPGTKATGGTAMEADVVSYEVYASTTTGFTPSSTNMLGSIAVGPAMVGTFNVPTSGGTANQTWYVKIIAVDNGGMKSVSSVQATATPTLIASTNIVDATITNAKIASVAADKLTAGQGIVTDLSVKSKLTMGDGVFQGSIESFGYTAGGTTGFHIGSDGLIIKSGSIAAPALNVSSGENLMPIPFATFENALSYYPGKFGLAGSTGASTGASATVIEMLSDGFLAKFSTQALRIIKTSASTLYLNTYIGATSAAGHPISIEPGTEYLVSGYVMMPIGATAGDLQFSWFSVDGNANGVTTLWSAPEVPMRAATSAFQSLPADGKWYRWSFLVPPRPTADALGLAVRQQVPGTYYYDGIQVETRNGNTYPGNWRPPTMTRIDGSSIRTGTIASTAVGTVWDDTTQTYIDDPTGAPSWSINIDGAATLANVKVNGSLVIGTGTETSDRPSTVASSNYSPGIQGWQIRSDGITEFRQMAADSIHGDTIQAGTLSVSTIGPGVLSPDIELTGALVATGLAGEEVRFSRDGFEVLGPTALQNPVYVNFPTDSALPNIISGAIQASTLEVSGDANGNAVSFKLDSTLEPGSRLFLTGAIGDPKSAPNTHIFWNQIQLATPSDFAAIGTWNWNNVSNVTFCHDNTYRGIYDNGNGYTRITWTSTGGYSGRTAYTRDTVSRRKDLVYAPATGGHYAILLVAGASAKIEVYNTSFGLQTTWTFNPATKYGWNIGSLRLGYNFTNNTLILVGRRTVDSKTGWAELSIATAGTITETATTWVQSDLSSTRTAAPIGGNFDYGSMRYLTYDSTIPSAITARALPAAGVQAPRATADEFPPAYYRRIKNMDYDPATGKILSITDGGQVHQYEPLMWPSTTSASWRFRYIWYKDSVEHSAPSPIATVTMSKRARISVTVAQIPAGATQAWVYRSVGTGAFLTVGQITPPSIVWKSLGNPTGGSTMPLTNTFQGAINPGQIISSTGNSYWRGDDTAQFYQLVLASNADASTAAGNKPALRIGSPTGAHLRIDNNEIIAMASDTASAMFFLPHFRARASLQSGSASVNVTALNTNFSVNINFPATFTVVPIVLCNPVATNANSYISVTVSAVTVNGFTATVARSTGTGTTSFNWFAHDDG